MKYLVLVLIVWLPVTTVISMEIGWHFGPAWQTAWMLPSILLGVTGGIWAGHRAVRKP